MGHVYEGMIIEVLPRKNKLSRSAPGPKPLEQIIAANVDQIIAVFAAAKPKPKWGMLDRYLIDAEAQSISILICITKMDIIKDTSLMETLDIYKNIGYSVILTSAVDKTGIDEFRNALKDRVSVFVGKSGVGKTTLLNVIQPGLDLRTNEVSNGELGKGKHTTNYLEMFNLDFGGSIVDTPGMREFGLWGVGGQNFANLFPEMRPYIGQCKFGMDCAHSHEPDCAIKNAVEEGTIDSRRYNSYLKMR
jgi:ribosome biogenesis GTPase